MSASSFRISRLEAARGLADLAREVLPASFRRDLAIEVRDQHGPVLKASMHFEAVILRPV